MPLTRDFQPTVVERVRLEPAFARALLDEAGSLFLNGDPAMVRVVLRDLVNATVGFEGLAAATERPSKSLHRMLSATGNPSMDIQAAIFDVLCRNHQGSRRLTEAGRTGLMGQGNALIGTRPTCL